MNPILLMLALVISPTNAATLSSIRDDCRNLIKDAGTSRRRFADATLNDFINEGQREVNQEILPIRKSAQFELVAGTTYYSLPTDCLAITRMTRDWQVIKQESIVSLDKKTQWQEVGGLPTAYYVSFASRTTVGFYPFPDTTSSTGTIRYEYASQITAITSDSDTPFNSISEFQSYSDLLGDFCAFRASVIDGENDMAAIYLKSYQDGKKSLSNTDMMMPNYNPGITPATR